MYNVYMHVCPNGKRYIGTTKQTLQKRFKGGWGYEYTKEFFSDIMKYGWENIDHIIAFENVCESEAFAKERGLIAYWGSRGDTEIYNIRDHGSPTTSLPGERNGMFGKTHTPEVRARLSAIKKERFKDKTKHPMFGKPRSEETRRKLSIVKTGTNTGASNHWYGKHWEPGKHPLLGKHPSEDTRRKQSIARKGRFMSSDAYNSRAVVLVETGETFGCAMDVKRKYGYDNSAVCKCCKTGKAYKGYHWKYI